MDDTASQIRASDDEYAKNPVVAAQLARLASATTDDEARLIESTLIAQTDNRTHEGDPQEQPQ